MKENWYEIENVDELDSPALVVYPDRIRHNIDTAIKMAGSADRLRPHVKTNKSPNVVRLMLQAGIGKFKCATISEAEMLAQCSAPDVLLAYQPTGPKLSRFVTLVSKYPGTRFSCLVDNTEAALEQSTVFAGSGLRVPVLIDINVGMNRTGIPTGPAVEELFHYCKALKGINVIGLHAYDGHIRDIDWNVKKAKCDAAFEEVGRLQDRLQLPLAVVGGSPSFSVHCTRPGIECSPGTFVYWDKGYCDLCPEQDFLPAAVLVTRIVSKPSQGKLCLDLGHKSVAAENEIGKRVFFLNAPDFKPVGQSEEHLVVETTRDMEFHPGDVIYGLPFHVCPTVALFERVYTVKNGRTSEQWMNVARDRKITI